MALNKVNLVRVKSGEFDPPQDGDFITYNTTSGLYLHTRAGDLADSLAPNIESSALNNDAGFYTPSTVPVRVGRARGVNVEPSAGVLDLGDIAYYNEVLVKNEGESASVYNGAYAQHWVSADNPATASGKEGDLWFVI